MGPKQSIDGLPKTGELFAGRYRMRAKIGQGGMGSVLLAEDERLGGKLRALKFTSNPREEEERGDEGFIAEATLLSQLQHPNLPQIVDYYGPAGTTPPCIVMDYIAGESLASRWLHHGMRLPYREILNAMLQLCDALRYLHAQRPPVVFRDLKPANVMIDHQGRAILVDFGIARRYRPEASADTMRLGTPGFAAPEQLLGEQSDERTDLYGLGALVYYLLSGGELASHGYRAEACYPDVPRRFRDLLGRLLAAKPSDRPGSAQALYDELERHSSAPDSEAAMNRRAARGRESSGRAVGPGTRIIAVLSAYPGAGATYFSLLLSWRLAALGAPHSLVECPGGEPELFSWLDGERRMPSRSVFCDPSGMLPIAPAWKRGTARYYPLHPEDGSRRQPEGAFEGWLRSLEGRLVVLDVSSRWEHPAVEDWVARHADRLLFVADSLPLKWSARRQKALLRIRQLAGSRGADTAWIANRDIRFRYREEWLRMLPEAPLLAIPDAPYSDVSPMLWNGEFPAADARIAALIDSFANHLWEDRPMPEWRFAPPSKGWHR
ncbi:serine/threonine-protein kinase [Cohnella sp. AR92]|uniref:serine/threonine protein kinase n=1 Tax=Cohnella sp. AR92 TaxID=648716 RepID=UPI000F8F619B|nr:serine/threonine-protein kinase [Cohnella sp. AR92]RUS46833.1 serine/threonine protein kinase [Cohnella sp. AR92]